jgi:hypothetical protein
VLTTSCLLYCTDIADSARRRPTSCFRRGCIGVSGECACRFCATVSRVTVTVRIRIRFRSSLSVG